MFCHTKISILQAWCVIHGDTIVWLIGLTDQFSSFNSWKCGKPRGRWNILKPLLIHNLFPALYFTRRKYETQMRVEILHLLPEVTSLTLGFVCVWTGMKYRIQSSGHNGDNGESEVCDRFIYRSFLLRKTQQNREFNRRTGHNFMDFRHAFILLWQWDVSKSVFVQNYWIFALLLPHQVVAGNNNY